MRPACGTYRMSLQLQPNSATLPWGQQHRFPPIIPTYLLAVAIDLVFSLQAAGRRCWQILRVLRVGRRVARVLVLARRNPQVAIVNAAESPITEPGLDELVVRAVRKGLPSATRRRVDISTVRYGLPWKRPRASDRSHNLSSVMEVSHQIAELVGPGPTRATTLTRRISLRDATRHDRGTPAPDFRGRRKLDRDLDAAADRRRNVETAQTWRASDIKQHDLDCRSRKTVMRYRPDRSILASGIGGSPFYSPLGSALALRLDSIEALLFSALLLTRASKWEAASPTGFGSPISPN